MQRQIQPSLSVKLNVLAGCACFHRTCEEFQNKYFPSCMDTQNTLSTISNAEDEQRIAINSMYVALSLLPF